VEKRIGQKNNVGTYMTDVKEVVEDIVKYKIYTNNNFCKFLFCI
jgi:hypothetical protein